MTKDSVVHFALSVVGKDRPGIVAGTTGILYRLGCNIEDSSSTMLGGEFAMILIISHPKPFTKSRLLEEFRVLGEEMGLTVSARTMTPDEAEYCAPEGEICMLSVYGSDKPGIVYRVTKELAERSINITDLNTKLVGKKGEPVYVMMIEAALPEGISVDQVSAMLEEIRKELNVEISVRSITPVSL
ncbi:MULTISPECIES: glycine cleavage system protein R [Geobacter]|uniref:glycine cleavage system protein R n=1 Tax=Geobacter TaxID=28231 RepID=UPI0025734C48|nr:ACT domain-containing protein [Geobacter sulfurreducens]BEH11990.1 amino acid-binding protein [Geobacter sulfurreducens subsp. ethanolicus]BET59856.1 amino acid-binding protein [Geobacter sp. 60473]HML77263.1 ACT domain-containing protein [Geobacter sulfurreducens]